MKIDEKTQVPLSLVGAVVTVVIVVGLWVFGISIEVRANDKEHSTSIQELRERSNRQGIFMQEAVKAMTSIDQRLSRIEGRLSITAIVKPKAADKWATLLPARDYPTVTTQ